MTQPASRRREFNVFGVLFLLLGLTLGAYAIFRGGWWWLALWPAGALVVVGVGYLLLGSRVFGKTALGGRRFPHRIALFPFTFATYVGWRAMRFARRADDPWNQVAPRLYIGRRAYAHELPPDVDLVIDLTAEFTEPAGVRKGRQYICLPTLDASVPDNDGQILALVDMLVEYPGTIYIHCAEGHGRAAMVTAFVLLAKGLAADSDEALALVKTARPKTNPRPWQRSRLKHWEELLRLRQSAAIDGEREA